jgi:hypothetical protein
MEMDMKKLTLFASLAILSVSSGALALTEGPARAVVVGGRAVGIATFYLNGNLGGPSGGCSYYMDWQGPSIVAGSAACIVKESKALGATSCLANRLITTPTTLTSSRDCEGFDQYGQLEQVTFSLAGPFTGAPMTGVAVFAQFPFLPQSIIIG